MSLTSSSSLASSLSFEEDTATYEDTVERPTFDNVVGLGMRRSVFGIPLSVGKRHGHGRGVGCERRQARGEIKKEEHWERRTNECDGR